MLQLPRYGDFANECRKQKKERPKKDGHDKASIALEERAETSLFLAMEEGEEDILIRGISWIDLRNVQWYLDIGVGNHMKYFMILTILIMEK